MILKTRHYFIVHVYVFQNSDFAIIQIPNFLSIIEVYLYHMVNYFGFFPEIPVLMTEQF